MCGSKYSARYFTDLDAGVRKVAQIKAALGVNNAEMLKVSELDTASPVVLFCTCNGCKSSKPE